MNDIEIVEGGHYLVQEKGSNYLRGLYIFKIVNMNTFSVIKKSTKGIVYSYFEDGAIKEIMSFDDFKKIVMYKEIN